MRSFYEKMKAALNSWSRRYVCDEDPDERRKRLQRQSLEEIYAQLAHIVQLRMAMRASLEPKRGLEYELNEVHFLYH